MTVKQGSSKKPRKTKRSYRVDSNGAKVKLTPNSGGGKTRLATLEKALINPTYLRGKSASIKRAIDRGRGQRGAANATSTFLFALAFGPVMSSLMLVTADQANWFSWFVAVLAMFAGLLLAAGGAFGLKATVTWSDNESDEEDQA
jgi:hypothetical protein